MEVETKKGVKATLICDILGISSSTLCNWKKLLSLPDVSERHKETYYCEESYNKIVAYATAMEAKHEEARNKKKGVSLPKNIEELKKAHPLVKDNRCFIEHWFPEM